MYVIYLRRNNINGKCYVGQTSDFRRRERDWKCLKLRYANKYIDNDRAEFGLDAWTVEVLVEVDTREEAWELEQYYIKEYNSIWPNGYNLSTGGSGHSGCEGFWLGKRHSDEAKQKMSEAKKGENNPLYGKHHSDETKQKISENNARFWKGKLNREDKAKQVYQHTLDKVLVKVWPSVNECGRAGYSKGAVSACCNNCYLREGNNIYKNHIWSYTEL